NINPSATVCPNGGDTVVLSGAPGMAQYVWYPGYIINPIDSITQPGTYTLVVTDGYGCTASSSVTITTPTQISVSAITKTNPSCNADSNAGITVNISGGVPSYIYSWSNGATTSSISGLSAGTYSVSVNDKCGSSATASITLTQPPLLRDSIIAFSNINCNGNNTGNISINVSGGSPSYTYSWSNSASNSSISGLSAGIYTVTITDKNGCAATASATLTQPTALTFSNISNTNENCNGGNNATASVTVSGGSPSYTYLWNPSGKSTPTVSNLSAGSYSVIVTDSAGCSLTTSVLITQPAAISTTISSDSATCINNNGSITVTPGGGTSPYSYSWSAGGNTNFSISSLSAGKYTVTITDASGCIDTTSGIVGINKTFTMTVTGTDSICKGQSVTLTASGAATYLWSTSNTSSTVTISPIINTIYWVIGTTGVCKDSIPYTINIYKSLASTMPPSDTICAGKPITLKVNIVGGKPAYTYSWSNGITNNSPGPFTEYPTTTTTYSIIVTDACNYITTDTMRIYVVLSGNASFIITSDTIAKGQAITLNNTSQNTTSWYWTFGDGGTSTGFNPTYEYTSPGTYQITLIGYNSYGCPDTAVKEIYVSQQIIIPNFFTPNDDGQNDVFYFGIAGTTCFHCDIFNRWGVLVYQLNSVAQGWPGIIRQTNDPASDGTYYYVLNYCDYQNVTHKLDGFITLIREKK
ncbi:MAG TPA: gliding motility-associated C-terminal domain-containing protein, partial [Bacteroidia bacterium]|nr:gliding motility-associated C-terminal domain-containing protein [Bacteroidia bacterium]